MEQRGLKTSDNSPFQWGSSLCLFSSQTIWVKITFFFSSIVVKIPFFYYNSSITYT